MGKGVSKAVDHLNKEIAPALLVSEGHGTATKPWVQQVAVAGWG
jgi:hypothetical protein